LLRRAEVAGDVEALERARAGPQAQHRAVQALAGEDGAVVGHEQVAEDALDLGVHALQHAAGARVEGEQRRAFVGGRTLAAVVGLRDAGDRGPQPMALGVQPQREHRRRQARERA